MVDEISERRGLWHSIRRGYSDGVDEYRHIIDNYILKEGGRFFERWPYNFGSGLAYIFPQVSYPIGVVRRFRNKSKA